MWEFSMSDEEKIARLRVKIDAIDIQLVELLNERARLALLVGIAKGGRNIVRPAIILYRSFPGFKTSFSRQHYPFSALNFSKGFH